MSKGKPRFVKSSGNKSFGLRCKCTGPEFKPRILPFLQRKGNCHSAVKKFDQTTIVGCDAENTVKITS